MSLKDEVKRLLDNKEFDILGELARERKGVVRSLFFFLYSTDDLLHWRAAQGLGIVAKEQAVQNVDGGRNIPRRLIWSLAEESGSTAWPAPEALGAVVAARPSLFPDLAPIVLSFIGDPILNRGVLWSARKIAEQRPELIKDSIPKVALLLEYPDPTIRGHAAWALGAMRAHEAVEELKKLQGDESILFIYDAGELQERTVNGLARQSIAEISG